MSILTQFKVHMFDTMFEFKHEKNDFWLHVQARAPCNDIFTLYSLPIFTSSTIKS